MEGWETQGTSMSVQEAWWWGAWSGGKRLGLWIKCPSSAKHSTASTLYSSSVIGARYLIWRTFSTSLVKWEECLLDLYYYEDI